MKSIIWMCMAILALEHMVGLSPTYLQQGHAQSTKKPSAFETKGKQKKQRPRQSQRVAPTRRSPSKRAATQPNRSSADANLERLKRQYRVGEINDRQMWEGLARLHQHQSRLTHDKQLDFLQLQANMSLSAGYPILASLYAKEAIQLANEPYRRELARSWDILWSVTQRRPLQSIVEDLAMAIEDKRTEEPPAFGRNWFYFVGNAYAARGDKDKALEAYRQLRLPDRYFLPGRYQSAILEIDADAGKNAEVALLSILNSQSLAMSPLKKDELQDILDYTHLALGRLYYQESDFRKAITHFRHVRRESPLFYDSLFEQSWTFFMGGYPNHALGALHGVESPFFKQVFNPEAPILRTIIFYWMCRYEDSRNSLADFAEAHSEAVETLGTFLDRQQLRDETAYQLFENLVSGVSASALGMPTNILNSAAEKDAMLLLRDQFASVIGELNRLQGQGVFRSRRGSQIATNRLKAFEQQLRREIGSQFLTELRTMKAQFERLYDQAQFLYVELLMSEKEQILGRELHASSKMSDVSMRRRVAGWGSQTLSWDADDKQEYWWDEVGYYIFSAQPQCNAK